MKKSLSTREFVLLALLLATLVVLGYVNIPQPAGLSITFNMIPVALAAIAVGPLGGAVIGGAFGLISFLQCFGIMGTSAMGAILVTEANPLLSLAQRFLPRLLDGIILGYLFRFLAKKMNAYLSCAVTGFFAAFINTLLFMGSLVLLFRHTEFMRGSMAQMGIQSMAGWGALTYIVASVGVNGVVEMIVSTILTGAIGAALFKAGLIHKN